MKQDKDRRYCNLPQQLHPDPLCFVLLARGRAHKGQMEVGDGVWGCGSWGKEIKLNLLGLTLKEINPEYSLEGLMLKLNLQYFGHLM